MPIPNPNRLINDQRRQRRSTAGKDTPGFFQVTVTIVECNGGAVLAVFYSCQEEYQPDFNYYVYCNGGWQPGYGDGSGCQPDTTSPAICPS